MKLFENHFMNMLYLCVQISGAKYKIIQSQKSYWTGKSFCSHCKWPIYDILISWFMQCNSRRNGWKWPSEEWTICSSAVHVLLSRFFSDFILILSRFYPVLSRFYPVLSRFYPDFLETFFIQVLSKFYPNCWKNLNKIKIKFWLRFFFQLYPDFILLLS